ncbi:type I toxin-antitoxin system Fst family toxin [Companilactobacillus kedongensis]|nr:type I toxin-antitoxin system Fst family toxin [Companilactobacillus kedongensis]
MTINVNLLYLTITAPIIVGIVISLFDHWLNGKQ